MIIGLGYQARSGKDTVADYLVLKHGFTKVAFADKLKQAASVIFGLTPEQLYGEEKGETDLYWNDTPRNIMQKLGTECLRKGYRDDVWVHALRRDILRWEVNKHWVISDVRYPNEANMVKELGGFAVQIQRPVKSDLSHAAKLHTSETAMVGFERWDYTIMNDRDGLQHVYALADHMLVELAQKLPEAEDR